MAQLLAIVSACISVAQSMNNGLARTPPMGWLSWGMFRCEVDCATYPTSCINADLYKAMGDHLAKDGYKDVGYEFVNIDDCWNTFSRNPTNNQQQANDTRFPSGVAGLADYMHNLGLKLGLYNDIGSESCASYTGLDGQWELDATVFAGWGIDMIKIDGCYADNSKHFINYPAFGKALNDTGRSIIYSCSWPAYISGHGETMPPVDNTTMPQLAEYCNLWRNYDDIQNNFNSVQSIISYWRRDYHQYYNDSFLNVAGPGNWNDPDMIIVGNPHLSMGEQETQFALWAIFAAPLLMSNDLRTISDESKALLQNKEIIAINQDPLGKQGGYIWMDSETAPTQVVWIRELQDPNSLAVVFQNTGPGNAVLSFECESLPSFMDHWPSGSLGTEFKVRNLLTHTDRNGTYHNTFNDSIASNSVGMYKITKV